MQFLSLQTQSPHPTPAPMLHPEIIEAVLEPVAEDQNLSLAAEASENPFCDVHLSLSGEVCPDPLLAMTQMGEAIADFTHSSSKPEAKPRQAKTRVETHTADSGTTSGRVSFSGASADGQTTWIGFIDLDEFEPTAAPMSKLSSVDEIERFIVDRSSWFTPKVRETPRLHHFSQRSQQPRIRETAGAIALLLHPQEQLLDVLPVRYQRKSSSLVLTEQRLLCLDPSALHCDAETQIDLSLNEIAYITLALNGLMIRSRQFPTEHRLYFSTADLNSLEILLSYFTQVIRQDSLPEARSKIRSTALDGGLVASLILSVGLVVSGTTGFQQQMLQAGLNAALNPVTRQMRSLNFF